MATLIGVLLLMVAIGVIGWPLLGRSRASQPQAIAEGEELNDLLLQKETAFSSLSELEKDYQMGNLSRSDYEELRSRYEEKAVAIMRQIDESQSEPEAAAAPAIDDEIEREVMALRRQMARGALTCASCGSELAPADKFCPQCGSPVGRTCPSCHAANDAEARFCTRCGASLR